MEKWPVPRSLTCERFTHHPYPAARSWALLCCQRTSRNDLTTVILKPDEPLDVALRRFRRSIQHTGLIQELRARTAYEKPTTERKRKKAAAVTRLRKQIRRSLPPKKLY